MGGRASTSEPEPPEKERSRPSGRQERERQQRRLHAARVDPAAQLALAIELIETSRDLEVVRPALKTIEERADPALRPLLHRKYLWCAEQPGRRDASGFIRAAIVRALRPIAHPDDRPILDRALVTYQMQGMYELCAELRAAALLTLNEIDPELAAYHASRLLTDPLTGFSGEPGLTAARLLGAQGELPALFAVAVWQHGRPEVVAECLRQLTNLPASLLPLLAERYREVEDEQLLLGFFDLLLAHPARAEWADEIDLFLQTTELLDLYGLIVTQIVAARDEVLVGRLRELAAAEGHSAKLELLRHALDLLPSSRPPQVNALDE